LFIILFFLLLILASTPQAYASISINSISTTTDSITLDLLIDSDEPLYVSVNISTDDKFDIPHEFTMIYFDDMDSNITLTTNSEGKPLQPHTEYFIQIRYMGQETGDSENIFTTATTQFITLIDEPSSGGCSDCTPPTLGYNSNGVKKVDNGVCINDSCMDGGKYHTEYPMQNTLLYFPNTISLKYYENGSPSNIQMAQLGLGVYEIGSPLSESQAVIEVWLNPFKNDIYNPSIKEIILTDKDEILSWYDATIKLVPCMTAHSANNCLEFNFKFGYAKPPQSPILVTNAWDIPRNTINNYINNGLNVIHYTPEIIQETKKYVCDDPIKLSMTRNNCHFRELSLLWK